MCRISNFKIFVTTIFALATLLFTSRVLSLDIDWHFDKTFESGRTGFFVQQKFTLFSCRTEIVRQIMETMDEESREKQISAFPHMKEVYEKEPPSALTVEIKRIMVIGAKENWFNRLIVQLFL